MIASATVFIRTYIDRIPPQSNLRMTIIEISPFRNGWKSFETSRVEPVF